MVPWTSIKEIMRMIRKEATRTALKETTDE